MTTDVREIIERTNEEVCRWYETGEIDSLAEVFADDCWQMPPHAEPLVGRDALHGFWSHAVTWGTWRFTLETQDVVVSGSIAVERGRYIVEFDAGPSAPEAMESHTDRGNYVVLWRRDDDGRWRIVWDAPVSTVPA
jgi:ketosteroid isomerase-like protein